MRKVADYLRTHPVVAAAIAIGVVGGLFLYLTTPPPVTQPAATPMPRVAVSPTPAPAAPEVAASPAPAKPAAPQVVDAGRPDPFSPLVRAETGRTGLPAVPPPAPLPPPLFPGQVQPGQVQPGQVPTPSPTPPPKDASTAELMGIVGDGGSAAIVKLNGQTHVVGQGDTILKKIRVVVIDITKRLVILEEDGERFELKMGGVSTRHAAATTRLGAI